MRWMLAFGLAAFLVGCGTTTTKYPIGTTTGLQRDDALTGTWNTIDDKTGKIARTEKGHIAGYFHILPIDANAFEIVAVEFPRNTDGHGEWMLYRATTARLGENRYLNIALEFPQAENRKPLINGTLPYLYRIEPNGDLAVFMLNQEKVIAAIDSGALAGTIDKHTYKYEGKDYGDSKDVLITSDPPALDAYFAKPEAALLFEAMGVLKRVD